MRIDAGATRHATDPALSTDGNLALQAVDLPIGLPFIGDEPPPCSNPSVATFFEAAGTLHDATAYVRACKRTCMGCPYLVPCREWSITERETWGVWGGMTPRERARERGRRARAELAEKINNA